jgi:L-ascorbate metabolism protein UlaG (beta-lactamase superfamily)
MPDRATWVGHATVLIELDGMRILTDPVLRSRVGPLRRHGPKPPSNVGEDLDVLLVSHLHHDHADVPSLRAIDRGVPVLTARGAGRFLSRRGFTAVSEMAPGDNVSIGRLTIGAVEADHPSESRLERESEAIGFLIEGDRRIYFAGDTDLFEGMGDLGPMLDLALLPIWGWGPTIGAGHLDPERAARATALISPRMVVPIHWGTLYPIGLRRLRPDPLRSPPRRFASLVEQLAPQVEARVLAPGDSLSLA